MVRNVARGDLPVQSRVEDRLAEGLEILAAELGNRGLGLCSFQAPLPDLGQDVPGGQGPGWLEFAPHPAGETEAPVVQTDQERKFLLARSGIGRPRSAWTTSPCPGRRRRACRPPRAALRCVPDRVQSSRGSPGGSCISVAFILRASRAPDTSWSAVRWPRDRRGSFSLSPSQRICRPTFQAMPSRWPGTVA